MRNSERYAKRGPNQDSFEHDSIGWRRVAIVATVSVIAGGCAALWFAARRTRSRRDESAALSRWEGEGGPSTSTPTE
jgi:hypothetical protein